MRPASTRGYVLVLALIFLGIFFTAGSAYLNSITASTRSTRYNVATTQALALAEAGIDQAISQLNQNPSYTGESNVSLGSGVYSVAVSDVNTNTKRLVATGTVPSLANPLVVKTVTALANINTSIVSFRYGAQIGARGLNMDNNAQVTGNLYSNGNVTGSGIITGDATVAGTSTISGVTVNGTARAHSLSNCSVGVDAYYQTISNCPVTGTKYPGSANMPTASMPISDAQIAAWETIAAEGGVTAGPYTIANNTTQTLGPRKIDGDLTVNGTLVLGGIVWVEGNITFGNGSKLTVSAITGNEGAVLIADSPGNEATVGTVSLSNNMTVSGNGTAGSYPMVLSTNSSTSAISLNNNAQSVILYASRGTIQVSNNAGANQITGYGLSLSNNAFVTYVSGLQSQSFYNGPGGSWTIVPRTYSILK